MGHGIVVGGTCLHNSAGRVTEPDIRYNIGDTTHSRACTSMFNSILSCVEYSSYCVSHALCLGFVQRVRSSGKCVKWINSTMFYSCSRSLRCVAIMLHIEDEIVSPTLHTLEFTALLAFSIERWTSYVVCILLLRWTCNSSEITTKQTAAPKLQTVLFHQPNHSVMAFTSGQMRHVIWRHDGTSLTCVGFDQTQSYVCAVIVCKSYLLNKPSHKHQQQNQPASSKVKV